MLLTQKTNLDVNTNEEQKEILPIAKESFPYLCSTTRLDCTPDKSVPWHWHNMFEISFIIKGELSLQTPDETHIISTGEIYFINNGVLHTCTAIGTIPCEYNTIHFDMHFLSGMYNSIYEEKYILPVMRNSALQFALSRSAVKSLSPLSLIFATSSAISGKCSCLILKRFVHRPPMSSGPVLQIQNGSSS